MTTWNNGPYPQDPNQAYYAGQPGYPPQQPGYPPQQPGAYPPPGYPGGYPNAPPTGYPGGASPYGFQGGNVPPPGPQFGVPDPYSQAGTYGGTSYPQEDPEVKGFDFSDKSIRRGFIRKVYSILMVQLFITLAFIAWFLFHEPTRKFIYHNSYLMWVAFGLVIACMLTLACCGEVRRKAPMNFFFLGLFTLAESFLMGCISSAYKSEEVLMAVGITAAVCLGLTLFAFQTKWDFTVMGGILFVAVIILFIFGIVTIFIPGKVMSMVYASLGALIFSVYLIYDTQLMMGGEHKYQISPEEYIFAALNLYVDIINIFMYILTIIGNARD